MTAKTAKTTKKWVVKVVYSSNGKPKKQVPDLVTKRPKKSWGWYALAVEPKLAGKIRRAIRKKATIEDLEGYLGRILNPKETHEVIKETKTGTKRVMRSDPLLYGYLIVNLAHNIDLLHLIKEIKGVIGFLPNHFSPVPLKQEEVDRFLKQEEETPTDEVKKVVLSYKVGDKVKILQGVFKNQEAKVLSITGPDNEPVVMVEVVLWNREVPMPVPYNRLRRV